MNFTPSNLIILSVILIAVIYLVTVLNRLKNYPLSQALNPFYKEDVSEISDLKKSLSPIITEIETQHVAKFIKHWSNKFENNSLTVQDVESLNMKIAEGNQNQVNGILAIHPQGRKMYNLINEDLKLKEEVTA